ncbi:hypothetical protein ACFQX6_19955 [Streptosporangium lutulentum]
MTYGEQWALLSARGFDDMFAGTWIEGDDPDEIARILGSDPAAAVPCGLDEAMREYEPYAFKELVWLGEHAPAGPTPSPSPGRVRAPTCWPPVGAGSSRSCGSPMAWACTICTIRTGSPPGGKARSPSPNPAGPSTSTSKASREAAPA